MFPTMRLAALLFVFAAGVLSLPVQKAPSVCNGHAQLCDRKYGNTTFLGSHDSFASSERILALGRTQEVGLESQLALGARMLQAQAHMKDGVLHFCHTNCLIFDGGSVENYLTTVKKFLDDNPTEVLTFIFTNPENVSVSEVWDPIFKKTGIADLAYVPPQRVMPRNDWPTLGSMIVSGKRVVIFLDIGAGGGGSRPVNYILPQFKMVWEDVYDPTDSNFPCKVHRTKGPLPPSEQLNLINHNLNAEVLPFVLLPDRPNSPRTNGVSSIIQHADNCAPLVEYRYPNFVLVDYINVGEGAKAVAKLNGL